MSTKHAARVSVSFIGRPPYVLPTPHVERSGHTVEQLFKRMDDGCVTPRHGIFYDSLIFDAYSFVSDLVRSAKRRIVLFDNYVDDTVLTILDKRGKNVSASIYTKAVSSQLALDLAKHNAQYRPIEIKTFDKVHDRFLCIDITVYHIGASLKDLGKKWFAFNRMEMTADAFIVLIAYNRKKE